MQTFYHATITVLLLTFRLPYSLDGFAQVPCLKDYRTFSGTETVPTTTL